MQYNQIKDRKREKDIKNRWDKQKTNGSMVDENPTISLITVNVNGPNIPSEKAKIERFDIKAIPNSADYKKTHCKYKNTIG